MLSTSHLVALYRAPPSAGQNRTCATQGPDPLRRVRPSLVLESGRHSSVLDHWFVDSPNAYLRVIAFTASTMPLPKKLLLPASPWHVAVAKMRRGPWVTVLGVGQGWLFAEACRNRSTLVGDIWILFGLFALKSPYWLMISAATPAALGVAIEVPCT